MQVTGTRRRTGHKQRLRFCAVTKTSCRAREDEQHGWRDYGTVQSNGRTAVDHYSAFNEFVNGSFQLVNWEAECARRQACALAGENSSPELKESISVVDAKSFFDHLNSEAIGCSDRRNAIEIQLIRQSVSSINSKISWIEHQRMIIDGLTKRRANLEHLYEFMRDGMLAIQEEEDRMDERRRFKASGFSMKRYSFLL